MGLLGACAIEGGEEEVLATDQAAVTTRLKVILGVSSGCFERRYLDKCWPWEVYADPDNVEAQRLAIEQKLTAKADDAHRDFEYQVSEVTVETEDGLLYSGSQNLGIFGGKCGADKVEVSILCKKEWELVQEDLDSLLDPGEPKTATKYKSFESGEFVALIEKGCWESLAGKPGGLFVVGHQTKIGAVLNGVAFLGQTGVLEDATEALNATPWYDPGECKDLKGENDAEKANCEFEEEENGTECENGVCQAGECVAKEDCALYEETYDDCWHAVYDEEYNVCLYEQDDDGTACTYYDGQAGTCEDGMCMETDPCVNVSCDDDEYCEAGSCIDVYGGYGGYGDTYGCTDPSAYNHDPNANMDDGNCTYDYDYDGTSGGYNEDADGGNDGDDGYDGYGGYGGDTATYGCTDSNAENYEAAADTENHSCVYADEEGYGEDDMGSPSLPSGPAVAESAPEAGYGEDDMGTIPPPPGPAIA